MIEEMSELIKALCKWKRNEGYCEGKECGSCKWRKVYGGCETHENIIEEMADVKIMLRQMEMIFGNADAIFDTKIKRLNVSLEGKGKR